MFWLFGAFVYFSLLVTYGRRNLNSEVAFIPDAVPRAALSVVVRRALRRRIRCERGFKCSNSDRC